MARSHPFPLPRPASLSGNVGRSRAEAGRETRPVWRRLSILCLNLTHVKMKIGITPFPPPWRSRRQAHAETAASRTGIVLLSSAEGDKLAFWDPISWNYLLWSFQRQIRIDIGSFPEALSREPTPLVENGHERSLPPTGGATVSAGRAEVFQLIRVSLSRLHTAQLSCRLAAVSKVVSPWGRDGLSFLNFPSRGVKLPAAQLSPVQGQTGNC